MSESGESPGLSPSHIRAIICRMKQNRFLFIITLSAVVSCFGFASRSLAAEPVKPLIPNDTFYGSQWAMDAINAPEAWAMATSSGRGVVVAVIDTGIDDAHPDLQGALWTNPNEIADNGKDDDQDGFMDDVHGWNFVNNSSSTRPAGSLLLKRGAWEHGTAVSSLIAGRGNNNIGMAGVAWNAKIMPLVILGTDGDGGTDRLVLAIMYAVAHHADIINMSVEGETLDPDVAQAIKEATAKGVLIVLAAGNGTGNQGYNLTSEPLYPACNTGAANQSVLVVTGVTIDGERAASANYGSCVNIAAPGEQVLAARPTYNPDGNRENVPGYGAWTGTSLAAPIVSGVAALVKAQHPEWTGEQVAQRLLDTARPLTKTWQTEGLGKGLLDAARAVAPADPRVYGPWRLWASAKGQSPRVWITDNQNHVLYQIPVSGDADRRGWRASFVRWTDERQPAVLVTAIGDETGEWRVYRIDGVLLAAGNVAHDANDKIVGGLSLAVQDTDASGRDHVLFSENNGNRVWLSSPDDQTADQVIMGDDAKPLGVMAVGMQRPMQTFLALVRGRSDSYLALLDKGAFYEGTTVTTTHPEVLNMVAGLSRDGRQLVRLVQSGPPTYFVERGDIMAVEKDVQPAHWTQAPLGMALDGFKDRMFYDVWPR